MHGTHKGTIQASRHLDPSKAFPDKRGLLNCRNIQVAVLVFRQVALPKGWHRCLACCPPLPCQHVTD